MSLADWLEKIQNKPRHVKVVIMWVGVAIFMTFFLILWVSTISSGQSNDKNLTAEIPFSEQAQTFSEVKSEIPSLWQSLKASVAALFDSINKSDQNAPSVQTEGSGQTNDDQGDNNNKVPPSTLP